MTDEAQSALERAQAELHAAAVAWADAIGNATVTDDATAMSKARSAMWPLLGKATAYARARREAGL